MNSLTDYKLYPNGLWPFVINQYGRWFDRPGPVFTPPGAWPIRIWKECNCA